MIDHVKLIGKGMVAVLTVLLFLSILVGYVSGGIFMAEYTENNWWLLWYSPMVLAILWAFGALIE